MDENKFKRNYERNIKKYKKKVKAGQQTQRTQ